MNEHDENTGRSFSVKALRNIGIPRVKDPVQRQRKADKVPTHRPSIEQLAAACDWSGVIERQAELCKPKEAE